MVVQKISGTVKGDGCLSGSRAALHHERTLQRCANDCVLLRLNGGDDVAHAARSLGVERSEKRAFARERSLVSRTPQRLHVQHVVLDRGDDPALGS